MKEKSAAGVAPLTRENAPLDRLYFVLDGNITIEKGRRRAFSDSKAFIGEDAFLLGRGAIATVTLEPGCPYFVWHVKSLQRLLQSNHALQAALNAVMNQKLAEKLALAAVTTDTLVLNQRRR